MTYAQMKEYFNILQDKFGSPYHTDDEIALLLNRAQIDMVMGLLPVDGSKLNIELNANTIARIAPILFGITTNTVGGALTRVSINTILDYTPVLRVLAIAVDGYPVRSVRFNNLHTYLNNIFKAPSATSPIAIESAGGWGITPVNDVDPTLVYGVRYPIEMLADGSINCELPDFTHNDIVSRALEMASVGSRDQMLAELKKLSTV